MSPIKYFWNALEQRERQRVPVPTNIQPLKMSGDNITQATINSLINSL
jgi:hypothetical protein